MPELVRDLGWSFHESVPNSNGRFISTYTGKISGKRYISGRAGYRPLHGKRTFQLGRLYYEGQNERV